ncbi:MAG: hypothetical protein HC857_10250 [Synechococcales cyanobacterium RU_4_20]|nr:hypothetical protein [Synechococcales cyanobacterium RU_4_20]NJR70490.1 hypothetical protein [Synechococcales cyanobacterium CRU_2_2]
MDITRLIFSWPREARYSCEPETYEGEAIEDYEIVIGQLQEKDRVVFDGRLWIVSALEEYRPCGHRAASFQQAIATLDGSHPTREAWGDREAHYLYVMAATDISLGWGIPTRLEDSPQPGDPVEGVEDFEVAERLEFEPSGSEALAFDRVVVCVCQTVNVAVAA